MPQGVRQASAECRPVCEQPPQAGPETHATANTPLHSAEIQPAKRKRQRRERREQRTKNLTMARPPLRRDDANSNPTSSTAPASSFRPRRSDGSFFASARNVGIEGGHFSVDSSVHQTRTNLTINLHAPSMEGVDSHTRPFDSSSVSTSRDLSTSHMCVFQQSYPWLDPNIPDSFEPTFPCTRNFFNAFGPHSLYSRSNDGRSSNFELREQQQDLAVDGLLTPETPVENLRQSKEALLSTSDIEEVIVGRADFHESDAAVQDSSDIYYRHLSARKRGYPLWVPDPNYHLPAEYRRKGISVGDVGMLTAEGGFDYLFNALLPYDHPCNVGRVPSDFAPLFPALDSSDIRGQFVFRSNSFITSPGVRPSFENAGDCMTDFYISGSEGAILVTPDGAFSEDLGNLARLRQYISENIVSWYRYANGPRGRELANGDLRLVIGCDKTSAWGMAAFAKPSQGEDAVTQLRFKLVAQADDTPGIKTYGWELHSGMAEVRSGPDLREIQVLSEDDPTHSGNPKAYENQCIFVRTLNITLNTAEWIALTDEIKVADGSDTQSASHGNLRQGNPPQDGGSGNVGVSTDTSVENNSLPSTDQTTNPITRHEVTEVPIYLGSHPSRLLNELILQRMKHLDVKMVITDDSDWSSVMAESESIMPLPTAFTERIIASSTPVQSSEGVVYLERKVGILSVQQSKPLHQVSDHMSTLSGDPPSPLEEVIPSPTIHQPLELGGGTSVSNTSASDTSSSFLQISEARDEMLPGTPRPPTPTNPRYPNCAESDEDQYECSDSGTEDTSRSGDETSDDDIEPFSERDFPSRFRQVDGRLYHSNQTAPYALPVDATEQQRCTMIHSLLHELIGAHYVGPVPEVLQLNDTRRRIALDVCTGNGDWMIDMVEEFPHVRFRGFDIVPIGTRFPPRNVQFEVYDLHEPFRWEDGTFDLVNMQFIAMTTRVYPWVLGEVSRVLRPGGLFVSYEWGLRPIFDPDNGALRERSVAVDFPAVFRLHDAVDEALTLLHVPPLAGRVHAFLQRTGGFVEISRREFCVPIGVWHPDSGMRNIGDACLEVHRRYADSVRALLVKELCTVELADSIIRDYVDELTASRGLVAVLYTVHARRGVAA